MPMDIVWQCFRPFQKGLNPVFCEIAMVGIVGPLDFFKAAVFAHHNESTVLG